jgi:predicted acylesterase/phospholipase RssA
VTVGSSDTAEAAREHADLVIEPDVEGVGLLDWRQLDPIKEAGRAAARAALEANPQWLGSQAPEAASRRRFAPSDEASRAGVSG